MEATAAASTHAASERRVLAAVMIACRESEPFSAPVRHARVVPLARMIGRVGHTRVRPAHDAILMPKLCHNSERLSC